MFDNGERVCGLKRVSTVERAAAKGCGAIGEKVREVIDETRFGIWWVLKEDQYLDSGVSFGVLGLGLSLGLTGLKVEFDSAIEEELGKL